MKKDNRGFSLVELIIVIAIMAILIGVLAPQYIKYVQKARITSDGQLLNSVYEAVTYAVNDPDVLCDEDSQTVIEALRQGCSLESIQSPAGNKLAEEVMDTLGWTDLNQSTYEAYLKSNHLSSATIYLYYDGNMTCPFNAWITTTDKTGGNDTSCTSSDPTDIGNCICVN